MHCFKINVAYEKVFNQLKFFHFSYIFADYKSCLLISMQRPFILCLCVKFLFSFTYLQGNLMDITLKITKKINKFVILTTRTDNCVVLMLLTAPTDI